MLALPAAAETVFSYPVDENPQRQQQLAALADAMSATARIEGRFTQTKRLQILTQPLISKGRFVLDAEGYFSWEIQQPFVDRKSTRLNSSHVAISYAVFCLKKKKKN